MHTQKIEYTFLHYKQAYIDLNYGIADGAALSQREIS